MISFDIQAHRFNLRAAAICLRGSEVLLHRLESDPTWALPGGRVAPGEEASDTVVRELLEETGETVQCLHLVYLAENFFVGPSKPQHEIGLYFLTTLTPMSALLQATGSHFGVEADKRLEFRWFKLTELAELNLRPAFLRTALCETGLPFRHVVQHG